MYYMTCWVKSHWNTVKKKKKSPTKSNHNPIFMQKCYILRLYSSEHEITALIFLKFKSILKKCRKITTKIFKMNCKKLKGLAIQLFTCTNQYIIKPLSNRHFHRQTHEDSEKYSKIYFIPVINFKEIQFLLNEYIVLKFI